MTCGGNWKMIVSWMSESSSRILSTILVERSMMKSLIGEEDVIMDDNPLMDSGSHQMRLLGLE